MLLHWIGLRRPNWETLGAGSRPRAIVRPCLGYDHCSLIRLLNSTHFTVDAGIDKMSGKRIVDELVTDGDGVNFITKSVARCQRSADRWTAWITFLFAISAMLSEGVITDRNGQFLSEIKLYFSNLFRPIRLLYIVLLDQGSSYREDKLVICFQSLQRMIQAL